VDQSSAYVQKLLGKSMRWEDYATGHYAVTYFGDSQADNWCSWWRQRHPGKGSNIRATVIHSTNNAENVKYKILLHNMAKY